MMKATSPLFAAAAAALLTVCLGPASVPGAAIAATSTDPVIAVAGDIACDPASASFNAGRGTKSACRQGATAAVLGSITSLQKVLPLGDTQDKCGGFAAYPKSYGPSWGKFLGITRPVVGNHEYFTTGDGTGCGAKNAGAAGYFRYFGAAAGKAGRGYYSYDVGAWHLIALNSNCSQAGGCGPASPQGKWLAADLAAHRPACTLAYMHHPLFADKSGDGGNASVKKLWDALYAGGAELVLAGHSHNYQRFGPQTPSGALNTARGIRQVIVGTGGVNHQPLSPPLAKNTVTADGGTFGVLQLTLHPNSWNWKFIPAEVAGNGTFTDSGSAGCH